MHTIDLQHIGPAQGARTADDGVDPFSRRKTRPMNYWTTRRQQQEAEGSGAAGARAVCPHAPHPGQSMPAMQAPTLMMQISCHIYP